VDPVIAAGRRQLRRSQLRDEGAVIASLPSAAPRSCASAAAAAAEGLQPIDDEALLDEVTALVERPNVLLCRFEPEFLAVPQECLILTMKANQKYFPLLDARGQADQPLPDRQQHPPGRRQRVIQGNERVVRPRLADAKFFFDQDRKKTLASRVPGWTRWSTTASWAPRASAPSACAPSPWPSASCSWAAAALADVLADKVARRCWPRPTC
jgi:glycyl-tRNA synthetase beta chain